jgi:ketosteroid isomerase-like protein
MSRLIQILITGMILLMADAICAQEPDLVQLGQQVKDTERAFAATMADRDYNAFTSFLSDEAVFFSGEIPLRGKQQVADAWKPYFDDPGAPFSWEPQQVEVLDSGTLALSSGPVFDSGGTQVATFNSIWQRDSNDQWKIVFDKGSNACNCPTQANAD